MFPFKHLGIEEGLPSTEVHDIHQDVNGYMWFATDHGLCQYDGFGFQIYSTQQGLTDNTIFDIIEQPDSSFLLSTFSGGITIFKNGWGRPYPYNDSLRAFLGQRYVHHIEQYPNGRLLFRHMLSGRRNADVCFLETDGRITHAPQLRIPRFTRPFLNQENARAFFSDLLEAMEKTELIAEKGNEFLVGKSGRVYWYTGRIFLGYDPATDHLDTLASGMQLFSMYEDRNEDLWFLAGPAEGLLRIRYKDGQIFSQDLYLPGQTISDIFEDREGNLWLSSVESGLFFLPNLNIQQLDKKYGLNGKMLSLESWHDRLWVGDYSNKGFYLTPDLEPHLWNPCLSTAGGFDLDAAGDYLLSTNRCICTQTESKPVVLEWMNPKAVTVDPTGVLYMGGVVGLVSFRQSSRGDWDQLDTLATNISVYSSWLSPNKTLWLGTLSGLYKYESGKLEKAGVGKLPDVRITAVKGFVNESLILGTKGEGILIYSGETVVQINNSEGLSSQFVKSILVENDRTIWVGGNQGLNRIRFRESGFEIESIEHFDNSNGLSSNEVFDLEFYQGDLWMATSAGLCRLELQAMPYEDVPPRLNFTRVMINKEEVNDLAEMQMEPGGNDLDFEYIGLYFRESEEVEYQYLLEGYDQEWQKTPLRKVSYTNLPSGEYRFLLRAKAYKDGAISAPLSLAFQIPKSYYEKWWFLVLAALLVVLFTSGIFLLVLRRQRARAAIERKVIQSEQTALRAQINPHFIFNAMNSIQYFITENDKHNAGIYLSRFSKLMRRILDNSRKNWVTLEEELAGLKNYLELEQMRFIEKFDYRVDIGPGVDPYETEIPAMILQPFLENAIWHGLMRKEEKGMLHLAFKSIPGTGKRKGIECIIEDNGIGREEAVKHRRRGHKSTGLQNIQERIQLINAQHKTKMQAEIEDLYDVDGMPKGTRVRILFPEVK